MRERITKNDVSFDPVFDYDDYFYPKIDICLYDTHKLNKIADDMRKEKGYLPFFDMSGEYDWDGWYSFDIEIYCNDDKPKLSSKIDFTPYNTSGDDYEKLYAIELTEEEQKEIFEVIMEKAGELLRESIETWGKGAK